MKLSVSALLPLLAFTLASCHADTTSDSQDSVARDEVKKPRRSQEIIGCVEQLVECQVEMANLGGSCSTPGLSLSPPTAPTPSAPTPTAPTPTAPTAPTAPGTVADVGNDGEPADMFPLQRCEGDCDEDSDCAGNLVCHQRSSTITVPGCNGEGTPDGTDYCIDPADAIPTPAPVPPVPYAEIFDSVLDFLKKLDLDILKNLNLDFLTNLSSGGNRRMLKRNDDDDDKGHRDLQLFSNVTEVCKSLLEDCRDAVNAFGCPPTQSPTELPTTSPSAKPSAMSSFMPSSLPSKSQVPSAYPSAIPSSIPTRAPFPSTMPSSMPTESRAPSSMPSKSQTPSAKPSIAPSNAPTESQAPSSTPSIAPSNAPTESRAPSSTPSIAPSNAPSNAPSDSPSNAPSNIFSNMPSYTPSYMPSNAPIKKGMMN